MPMQRSLVFALLLTVLFPLAIPAQELLPFTSPLEEKAPPKEPVPALFGLNWGDWVQAGMEKIDLKTPPGLAVYRRPADKLELFGVRLLTIRYIYDGQELAGIWVTLADNQKAALIAELNKRWKNGTPGPAGSVRWFAKDVMAVLSLMKETGAVHSWQLSVNPTQPPN